MLTIGIIIGVMIVMPIVIACTFHAMLRVSLGMRNRDKV